MAEFLQNLTRLEKGSRRTQSERRTFSYTAHIPERRSGKDRRRAVDAAPGKQRRLSGSLRLKNSSRPTGT